MDGHGAAIPAQQPASTGSFASWLAAMLERGCGLVVGTAAADGEPLAERAWGARVVDEASKRLRLTMGADDERVMACVVPGSGIAVTGADVRTLAAVQVKGSITWTGPADDVDLAVMEQQTELFLRAIAEVDRLPIDQLRLMVPLRVVAVEFEVDQAFDQSAGPGAGARMASA